MLIRGADIGYLGSTMPRSPSSSFGDGSVDLVYIPRRELLGVAGSCAVAAPISGAGLECFCLTSGVLGNEPPKQDNAVGLAAAHCSSFLSATLDSDLLGLLPSGGTPITCAISPFGGAFFQPTQFARSAVKSSTCATSTRLPAFHYSAWNAKLLHANSNVQWDRACAARS
jgi:hypothetical protein